MDYSGFVDTAAGLIAEYGMAATHRRVVAFQGSDFVAVSVDATAKTYTRASGSWIAEGFVLGDSVTFEGFAEGSGNNGAKVVSAVSALVLTCATATGLVDVTDAAGVKATANHDTACNVLELFIDSVARYASSLVEGSALSETMRYFLLVGTVPLANDKLVVGTAELTVEAVSPLAPGGVAIYYAVRCRA